MPSKYDKNLYRIDLIQEVEWYDEKTHQMKLKLTPNPERYEWKTVGGTEYLCDKFEKIMFSKETFAKFIQSMKGKGLYWVKPDIDNIIDYINERVPKISSFFEEHNVNYEFKDKSEEFLNSIPIREMTFTILCIDLQGSTQLSQRLSPEDNAKIMQLFLKEMTVIVAAYHGYVLKYVGDGLIAYFPEPNFLGMEDIAVDCAVTMKFLIEQGINKVLMEKNMPELKFRIGLDTGEAIVSTVGDISSKQHKDLIGLTINFASKIQGVAKKNQIVIGDSTKKQLHTTRKTLFEEYNPNNWDYKIQNTIYQLHSLVAVEPH